MNKALLLVFLLINSSLISAQSLSPSLLSSGGSWIETSEVQLSWSVGEMMTSTLESDNSILTQGFEQAWLTIIDDITEITEPDFSFKLFPNPTAHYITLEKTGAESETFRYQLIDVQGRQISSKVFTENQQQIDMTYLPSGVYFLSIFLKSGDLHKTIQVQKLR